MFKKVLLILCFSFALSSSQISENGVSKLSLMISQKVAVEASKNLTESGHNSHSISLVMKEFIAEAPAIIEEEIYAIKDQIENEGSSISKRSVKDWLGKRKQMRLAKAHAQNVAIKVKSKLQAHLSTENSLSKRNFGAVTLGEIAVGGGYGALTILVSVLVIYLMFFLINLFHQIFWGYGYNGYGGYYGYAPQPYLPYAPY
jgi:hypothetical protein